jgi:hypothetical protein
MSDLKSYASVQRWIENVNKYYQLPDEEWGPRLEALAVYCERAGKNPDAIIQDALEVKGSKPDFMRLSKQVAKEVKGDGREAHDWDGYIRSFFIHNGARVVTRPYEE